MTYEEAREYGAKANRAAREFIAFVVFAMVFSVLVNHLHHDSDASLALVLMAPLVLIAGSWLAGRFLRTAPTRAPKVLRWVSALGITAAVAFDVIVTVARDPNLDIESNPFVRTMRDYGLSVSFVTVYGLVCQALVVALFVTLCWAALSHFETQRMLAWGLRPRSAKEFRAAARGIVDVSLFHGSCPQDYWSVPALAWASFLGILLAVGGSLVRVILGLEWLGFPYSPALRVGIPVVVGLVVQHAIWTRAWNQGPPSETDLEGAPERPPVIDRRRARLVTCAVVVLAVALALAVRERVRAADVEAELDERITSLHAEIAEAQLAARHASEIAQAVEHLEADRARLERRLPERSSATTLVSSLNSILEPIGLGVTECDLIRPRKKDYYDEHPVAATFPGPLDSARLQAELKCQERLIRVSWWPGAPEGTLMAFEWRGAEPVPELRDYSEMPVPRSALHLPFDRGILRRQQELMALQSQRDRDESSLLELKWQRWLSRENALRESIADKLARDVLAAP